MENVFNPLLYIGLIWWIMQGSGIVLSILLLWLSSIVFFVVGMCFAFKQRTKKRSGIWLIISFVLFIVFFLIVRNMNLDI